MECNSAHHHSSGGGRGGGGGGGVKQGDIQDIQAGEDLITKLKNTHLLFLHPSFLENRTLVFDTISLLAPLSEPDPTLDTYITYHERLFHQITQGDPGPLQSRPQQGSQRQPGRRRSGAIWQKRYVLSNWEIANQNVVLSVCVRIGEFLYNGTDTAERTGRDENSWLMREGLVIILHSWNGR